MIYLNQLNDKFYANNLNIEKYLQELKKSREIDKLTGGASLGPHKSDYQLNISLNLEMSLDITNN